MGNYKQVQLQGCMIWLVRWLVSCLLRTDDRAFISSEAGVSHQALQLVWSLGQEHHTHLPRHFFSINCSVEAGIRMPSGLESSLIEDQMATFVAA